MSGDSSDGRRARLAAADPWHDVVEERIVLAEREVVVVRPRDSIALLDEEAFEREEFLPYWADLWPSAVALARAVAARPLSGRRVLELGCGLGLPSLAAALAGARVLATDWSPDAVAFAAANAARNGLAVETQVCAWSQPEEIVDRAPWDLVLAADVLYEPRNVEQLLDLLPRLVEGSGEVWLADPHRAPTYAFLRGTAAGWERTSQDAHDIAKVTLHVLRRTAPPRGAGHHGPRAF